MRILLASASERRGTILRQRFANVEQVALKGVNESVPRQVLSSQVMEVASRKAKAVVFNDEFDQCIIREVLDFNNCVFDTRMPVLHGMNHRCGPYTVSATT